MRAQARFFKADGEAGAFEASRACGGPRLEAYKDSRDVGLAKERRACERKPKPSKSICRGAGPNRSELWYCGTQNHGAWPRPQTWNPTQMAGRPLIKVQSKDGGCGFDIGTREARAFRSRKQIASNLLDAPECKAYIYLGAAFRRLWGGFTDLICSCLFAYVAVPLLLLLAKAPLGGNKAELASFDMYPN